VETLMRYNRLDQVEDQSRTTSFYRDDKITKINYQNTAYYQKLLTSESDAYLNFSQDIPKGDDPGKPKPTSHAPGNTHLHAIKVLTENPTLKTSQLK